MAHGAHCPYVHEVALMARTLAHGAYNPLVKDTEPAARRKKRMDVRYFTVHHLPASRLWWDATESRWVPIVGAAGHHTLLLVATPLNAPVGVARALVEKWATEHTECEQRWVVKQERILHAPHMLVERNAITSPRPKLNKGWVEEVTI